MVTEEMLKNFCSTDELRHLELTKPWSDEQYSYATDGSIIVRVQKLWGVRSRPGLVSLERLTFDHESISIWNNLPEYSIDAVCPICAGSGRVLICARCGGEGEVYDDDDDFCSACDGEGKIPGVQEDPMCEDCLGKGHHLLNPVPWGNGFLSMRYLEMIKLLPEPKLGPLDDPLAPCRFIFSGGVGIVMPRRG